MSTDDVVGVASKEHREGALFVGPERRVAWSPKGLLSLSLAWVVNRDVAVHPWDPWPNPAEQSPAPPLPRRRRPRRADAARQARERRQHG